MERPGYPTEFRRKVLDLLADGRSVASVAHDLESAIRRSMTGAARTSSTAANNPG